MLETQTSNSKLIGLRLKGFTFSKSRLSQCANFCFANLNLDLSISIEITWPAFLHRCAVRAPFPAPISNTFSVFTTFASRIICSITILSVSVCCPREFGPVNLISSQIGSCEPHQLFLQRFSLLSVWQGPLDQSCLGYLGRTRISWLLSLLLLPS